MMSLLRSQSPPGVYGAPAPLPAPPPTGPITLELPQLTATECQVIDAMAFSHTVLDSGSTITADWAWNLYQRAFAVRRRPAAGGRPDLSRNGFDALMADTRVTKLVVMGQTTGEASGLATVSADLTTAPAAVHRALTSRWPELVKAGRVWYVSLLLVDPEHQDYGTTAHLLGGIWARAAGAGGLAAVDTSGVSDVSMNVPTALFQLARDFAPRTTLRHLDDPRFWAYEFPTVASQWA